METDCFPTSVRTFFLRSDFALEFCWDYHIRQPFNQAQLDLRYPRNRFSEKERAMMQDLRPHNCPRRYVAYLGLIQPKHSFATPRIWDGVEWMRVSEEGLFRAMLNRAAESIGGASKDYPVIYPAPLAAPADKYTWPTQVVLHDTQRSLAGLLGFATAKAILEQQYR